MSDSLIVIPTYDEIDNIEPVLTRALGAAPTAEVLVVDDASPDGTADRAEELGRALGQITVLRRSGPRGLGHAYRDGFRHALAGGYDVVVEMDADLSHDPADVPRLVDALDRGADLVIGSRYVPGGSTPGWSTSRRTLSRAGGTYARRMLRLPVRDLTSGFRAYRASVLRRIDPDSVTAAGYGFQIEMAYRVERAGGRVVEVPIRFGRRVAGVSKLSPPIVVEAMAFVTRRGLRDRIPARHSTRYGQPIAVD